MAPVCPDRRLPAWLLLCWLLFPLHAHAALDPEDKIRLLAQLPRTIAAGPDSLHRHGPRPDIYEVAEGTGGLHIAGNLWMHVDNTNFSPGNPWAIQGLNQDPSAQWPAASGVEYLGFSSLWVGAKLPDNTTRVSDGDEIRGGLPGVAHTRHTFEGDAHSRRGFDDDGDRRVDEDYLNGLDDDGDGQVDEDVAAISPDMFSTEMNDYTPEAIEDVTGPERHQELGIRVRRDTYAWSGLGHFNFVGIHYQITNVTRQRDGVGYSLRSVYPGIYWRPVANPRVGGNSVPDDVVGRFDIAWDGKRAPSEMRCYVSSSQCRADSTLRVFWGADDDGDQGKVPGAGAFLYLGSTAFPRLGFRSDLAPDATFADGSSPGNAPRLHALRAYRVFLPVLPYQDGGRPTIDAQRYEALSGAGGSTTQFPGASQAGTFRCMLSIGPYPELAPDSTIEFDLAFCVGKADARPGVTYPTSAGDLELARERFGGDSDQSLLHSCFEAWDAWRGLYRPNPGFVGITNFAYGESRTGICNSPLSTTSPCKQRAFTRGFKGKETCIFGEAGRELTYQDCTENPQCEDAAPRALLPQLCSWFDLDCEANTGVCNDQRQMQVHWEHWNTAAAPPPPRTRIVAGDRVMSVLWDDYPEHVLDFRTGRDDFKGYRLYKAVGWKRDPETGLIGPVQDLWQLVGDWVRPGLKSTGGFLSAIRDSTVPDSVSDPTAPCASRGCKAHPVGYYHYVDHDVVNGFRYFYAVTGYDENPKPAPLRTAPDDTLLPSQESGRGVVEKNAVVGRTDCAPTAREVRVVPNPYRFGAGWDLRGSSADPTGTHINFNHLPCGAFTLRIFTVAGDLVRAFTATDTRSTGTLEWDLISRNGQDIRGGIYVYSLDSRYGQSIGRFTVIR